MSQTETDWFVEEPDVGEASASDELSKVEIPWETSPPSQAQLSYFRELLIALANADLESRDTTLVSQAIDGLNRARKSLGVPFREFGI